MCIRDRCSPRPRNPVAEYGSSRSTGLRIAKRPRGARHHSRIRRAASTPASSGGSDLLQVVRAGGPRSAQQTHDRSFGTKSDLRRVDRGCALDSDPRSVSGVPRGVAGCSGASGSGGQQCRSLVQNVSTHRPTSPRWQRRSPGVRGLNLACLGGRRPIEIGRSTPSRSSSSPPA